MQVTDVHAKVGKSTLAEESVSMLSGFVVSDTFPVHRIRFNDPHEIPIFTDFQPDNYTSAAKQSHIFTSDQIGVCMQ